MWAGCASSTSSKVESTPSKPDLPIAVTFRPAANDKSFVATYLNNSNEILAVLVTLNNPTTQDGQEITLVLPPKKPVEQSKKDIFDWAYMSGDTIVIRHNNFSPMLIKVP
jgi:hypothetical protein